MSHVGASWSRRCQAVSWERVAQRVAAVDTVRSSRNTASHGVTWRIYRRASCCAFRRAEVDRPLLGKAGHPYPERVRGAREAVVLRRPDGIAHHLLATADQA